MYDALLTIGLTMEQKGYLHALSIALGMSGKGAVVRAVLDGRLPPLPKVFETLNIAQQRAFNQAYREFMSYE